MAWIDRLFGDDHQRAAKYEGRESASDRAARIRREKHHARVQRHGDNAGQPFPRRLFRGDN